MSLPLKDNPRHVAWLCEQLGLGRAGGALAPVSGGLHHRMWRLDTSKGSFAVKQLGLERELAHLDVAGHYNATEAAAAAFAAAGIPALHALSSSDYLQQIDDEAYLVYPWTEARAVGRNRIPPEQAAQVAVLMAKMHRAGVDVPGLEQSRPNWLSSERLAALLQGAMRHNLRDAEELSVRSDLLLAIADGLGEARAALAGNRLVSHGDLDHKNILWDEAGAPLVIDWESTRWLNPTHELLLEALDWSGITAHFEINPFRHFLEAYRGAGGIIDPAEVPAAFNCILGDWVTWLMYNLGRAMNVEDLSLHQLGSEQVDLALSTVLRIEHLLPRLRTVVDDVAGQREAV